MGTREIIFLLYTFILPAIVIALDDAKWDRKKPQAAEKATRTPAPRSQSESSRVPPGVAHQM
jgi:hypothetical protein